MADLSYSDAHSAASAAIVKLGYLTDDALALRMHVDRILSIAVSSGRFVHNRQKAASKKQVEKEVEEIRRASEHLSDLINKMHGTTYDILTDAGLDLNKLDSTCSGVHSSCKHLVDTSNVPPKLPKAKTKAAEQQIAQELADIFSRHTGRPASVTYDPYSQTTSGDFLGLVQAVFTALGIKSSAISSVDHVRRRRSSGL
jgi:hypothetical protein